MTVSLAQSGLGLRANRATVVWCAPCCPLTGPVARDRSAYRGLADGIRRLVADGRLLVGTRLPSERTLTTELGLSRTTVGAALDALRDEGFVATRRGSGSVVCLPAGPSGLALSQAGLIPTDVPPDVIDLTYAALRPRPVSPRPTSVPSPSCLAIWQLRATTRTACRARAAVAAWFEGRGHPPPDQVVMTSGAPRGLSAVLRAELEVGDRVLIESPTLSNAIVGVRRSTHHRAVPTQLTARGGTSTASSSACVRAVRGRHAYLIPDLEPHRSSSTDTRRAVGDVLRGARAVPVIDETFVELGLEESVGDAPPARVAPFAAHAQAAPRQRRQDVVGRAARRLGACPARLGRTGHRGQHSLDLGTAVLEQLVVVDLLRQSEGLLAERRREARTRRDAIVDALRLHVPSGVSRCRAVASTSGASCRRSRRRPRPRRRVGRCAAGPAAASSASRAGSAASACRSASRPTRPTRLAAASSGVAPGAG